MITASIITKNEEMNITRCLNSLLWVDEIIIVDSGSNDKTVQICKDFGCKIIETSWLGFGQTKQLGVEAAKNDWILSIDADEEVSLNLAHKIKDTLPSTTKKAFEIRRKSFYIDKLIKYSGWKNDYPVRLFNRKYAKFDSRKVHEKIILDCGAPGRIKECLNHFPFPNIETHIKKINLYSTLGANALFERKKKYLFVYPFLAGLYKFFKTYFLRKGFLDGREGLLLSLLSSLYVFLKYMKLWILWKQK